VLVALWAAVAQATCFGPMPCQVARVDAACAPAEGPVAAGAALSFTASCLEVMCCAGSAESCSSSYRPWAPTVWHRWEDQWVQVDRAAVVVGTCGEVSRYEIAAPPPGTLRIDGIEVVVEGDPRGPEIAWPPGFPALTDGEHARVAAPTGTATVALEGGRAALGRRLRSDGWDVGGFDDWAVRDGVLVWIDGTGDPISLTWRTLRVPVPGWWEAEGACPPGGTLALLVDPEGWEVRSCRGPDGRLDGPFSAERPGLRRFGTYAGGQLDGDWLELADLQTRVARWDRGMEDGHWLTRHASGALFEDGRWVAGLREGPWHTVDHLAVNHVPRSIDAEWRAGRLEGPYRAVTAGGLREEGAYRRGVRDGWFRAWAPDGTLVFEGEWADGLPVGVHQRFASDGALYLRQEFAAGVPTGTWRRWEPGTHRLEVEERFVDGRRRSTRRWKEDEWRRWVRERDPEPVSAWEPPPLTVP
jgi:hypothetical protein